MIDAKSCWRYRPYRFMLAAVVAGGVRAVVEMTPLLMAQAPSRSVATSTGKALEPSASVLGFHGVTVVDVMNGRLLPKQTVIVVGNRIQAVGAEGQVRVPKGTRVIDAQGKYMIPGLWDMHVHLYAAVQTPSSLHPVPFYAGFIANGVTGIREMGQRFKGGTDSFRIWQKEVATGARVGPRTVGPSIDLTDGMENAVSIKTSDDARRVIDSLKAAGMVFLKYHSGKDRDVYFAILREARRVGLPVVGHLPRRDVTEVELADSGQRGLEHTVEHRQCFNALTFKAPIDSTAPVPVCEQAAEAYVRNGTWLTPTLTMGFHLKGSMAPRLKLVRIMRRHGVTKFLSGTDTAPLELYAEAFSKPEGLEPGVSVLEELVFLVEAGLTPLEALQAATLNPATFLAATDSIGTVAPGKLADLVLLDANPLADIANVVQIRAVVANGRYFDRAALDALDPQGAKRAKAFVADRRSSANVANPAP